MVSLANQKGASTAVYNYGPFGEPNTMAGNMRFRYTGQQLLAPLGLYYYKARMYSPSLGRFLQTDPIGTKDDINLYAYVKNNAIKANDPTGLKIVYEGTKAEQKALRQTVSYLTKYPTGKEQVKQLKNSEETYTFQVANHDGKYIYDPIANTKTVKIDLYNTVNAPTEKGMRPTPPWLVLGHELGHTLGKLDDGPNGMNNVDAYENPLRKEAGYPSRTEYYFPADVNAETLWNPYKRSDEVKYKRK